jgi:hypothetical protein
MPTCPRHKMELEANLFLANILQCPESTCDYGTTKAAAFTDPLPAPVRQAKLPGLDRGKQSRKVKVVEKDLQAQVVGGLRRHGYTVLEIGKSRKGVACRQCGTFTVASGWQGNTPATPDLQIRSNAWPRGVWLDIELKGSETEISDEQQRLCDDGGSYICWSWEEVWAIVQATDKILRKETTCLK